MRNYSATYNSNCFLFSLLSLFFFQLSFGQLISNSKGEFNLGIDYFNSQTVKNRKIKSVTISYFNKKSLQPITKISGISQSYQFDAEGRVSMFYSCKANSSLVSDTMVEWRFYKNNKLETIKKTTNSGIDVQTIFYDEGQPYVEIFGKSENRSRIKTRLNIISYQEKYAEYISFLNLKNGDSVINRKTVGGKVVEKSTFSYPDSNTVLLKVVFPYTKFLNYERRMEYEDDLLKSLIISNTNNEKYLYEYGYTEENKFSNFTKTNLTTETKESFSEFVYDENTQNLQAIITKDYKTEEVSITKYKYTYYP